MFLRTLEKAVNFKADFCREGEKRGRGVVYLLWR